MGPLFWRHPEHGLKKCSERTREHCTDHEDCCSVTPCGYCVELEIYGEQIQYGFAEQDESNHWIGTVGNHSFDMYWHRVYDECFLFVLFDGEEVYAKTCYQGVKCRDSSDETEVAIGYDNGVLRWKKHEPLPLPHIIDPDTGCKTWYCDSCDCSCACLCATITEPDGRVQKGELCNVAYECEPPIWEGQIGYYDLSLALGRDIYGRCIIVATVDGEEQTAVLAPGCKNLSTIIELYDGTTIEVACKICACEEDPLVLCCGGGKDAPAQLFAEMGQCFVGRLAGTDCEVSDWSAGANGSGTLTSFERSGEGRLASYHGQLTITEQGLVESDGICSLVDSTRTINLCIECALGTDEDAIDIRWSNATEDSGNLCVGSPFPHDGISITIENCGDIPELPDCPTFTDSDVRQPVWAVTPAWTYSGGGVYVIACCDPFLIYVFVEKDSVPDWPSGGGWLLITE